MKIQSLLALSFALVLCAVAGVVPEKCLAQTGETPELFLSVSPSPATPADDLYLKISLANLAVTVLSTPIPSLQFDGNTIHVTLNYVTPDPGPGPITIPSEYFPGEETISLGRLPVGQYDLFAAVYSGSQGVANFTPLAFSVVPEPSSLMLAAGLTFAISFRRRKQFPFAH